MGHDAFTHHGLGSSALMLIGALHARPAQTIGELVGSASVSRATATVQALSRHAKFSETWDTYAHPPLAVEAVTVTVFGTAFASIGTPTAALRHNGTALITELTA